MMRDSASVKLRWAWSSGVPGCSLPSSAACSASAFASASNAAMASLIFCNRPSRKDDSSGNAPRLSLPYRRSSSSSSPGPAAATPPPPTPTAFPSPSYACSSWPCAWMRWPSPWYRPAPRAPASPFRPAGTASTCQNNPAHPGGPSESRRWWCGSRACYAPPAPERPRPRGGVGRCAVMTPPRRSSLRQHLDHHPGVGWPSPPFSLVARRDVRQIQLVHQVGDEVGQMILRQPFLEGGG